MENKLLNNIVLYLILTSFLFLLAVPGYSEPPIVKSSLEIEQLNPSTTTSIRARALPDGDIHSLARLRNLRYIFFNTGRGVTREAEISDKGLKTLSELDLPCLELIGLSYCNKISDEGLLYISGIKQLKQLLLEDCKGVTDRGLEYIAGMENLEYLDLRYCTVSGKGLEHLAELKNINYLDLSGCPNINREESDKFQKIKPNCTITASNKPPVKLEKLVQTKQPKSYSLIASALYSVLLASPLIYLVIQIIAAIKLKGFNRVIVALPAPVMLIVVMVTFYGYQQQWNLWPIYLIFISPLAILYVAIMWLFVTSKK